MNSAMKKIKRSSTIKPNQKALSTTKNKSSAFPLTQPSGSVSSTSSTGSDTKGKLCKKDTVSQDDLEYAHNFYLLALATSKLQEKALSEVTAENENHRVKLLSEVETNRSHLAALTKRYEEVAYLSRQSQMLRCKRQELEPVVDLVLHGLKDMDMLRNALDFGLPVKGFQPELSACGLKSTLSDGSKVLEKSWGATCEHGALYAKACQEVADILSALTNIVEAQNRCCEGSTALSHEVLTESCLKVMKQRKRDTESACSLPGC